MICQARALRWLRRAYIRAAGERPVARAKLAVNAFVLLLMCAMPCLAQTDWHDQTLRYDRAQLFLRMAPVLFERRIAADMRDAGVSCDWWWSVESPSEEGYSLGFSWVGGRRCGTGKHEAESTIGGYVQLQGVGPFRLQILVRSADEDTYRAWFDHDRVSAPSRKGAFTPSSHRWKRPPLNYPPDDESAARRRFEELRPILELIVGNSLTVRSLSPTATPPDGSRVRKVFGWKAWLVPADKTSGALGCSVEIDPVRGDVTEVLVDHVQTGVVVVPQWELLMRFSLVI